MKQIRGVWLPDSDSHFGEHLQKGPDYKGRGTYQFKKIGLALPFVREKKVAIDVGGHVGLWSMILADQFDLTMAYEPVPEHIECFTKNTAEYARAGKLQLRELALGASPGKAHVTTTANNSGNAHVATEGIEVDISTLDFELVRIPRIDFIKIDVEGYEEAVVCGGEQVIKKHKPVLVVEQKPGHAEQCGFKTGAVIDLLKSWGYKIAWIKSGDFCLVRQ